MNTSRNVGRDGLRPLLWLGLIALLLSVWARPQRVLAHALDAYLQATYLTVSPTRIEVELNLTPGVLLAPQVLLQLDPNGDQQISDAEGQAYVDAVLQRVVLQVDEGPLALSVTKIEMPPYLNIQAGYGTIRVFTTAPLADGMTGTHQINFKNNFAPTGSVYQVNALVNKEAAITLGKQNRDSLQQGMTMDYVIGASSTASAPATTTNANAEAATGVSDQARQLLAFLYAPTLTAWGLAIALAFALVIGGLHALAPGHGKTLVAAYLVGSRGTVQHAVLLGGITTFTHTISVITVGLLALAAQNVFSLNGLMPVLEIGSGLLVLGIGVQLLLARWRALRNGGANTPDTHDHGFGAHTHTGDAAGHQHLSRGGLLAMGVSGGLIPCPEALGIMLISIGLNRAGFGLGLVVAFSLGLAGVLIALGIALVRAKTLMERMGHLGVRWHGLQRWLPLAGAVAVTGLGAALVVKGVMV